MISRAVRVPILFLLAAVLTAACEREPPPELVEEVESLRAERDALRTELDEAAATVEFVRSELRADDLPRDLLDEALEERPGNVRDSLRAVLRTSTRRATEARAQVEQVRGRLARAERRVDSLESAAEERAAEFDDALDEERRRVTELRERARELASEKEALEARVARLEEAAGTLEADLNRVYYVAGTPEELRRDGIVEKEGGARVFLLFWRRGEVLVPARDPDPQRFTPIDLREVTEIPLPRSDVWYRVVSRHDVDLLEADRRRDGGRIRGETIRITDPEAFWRSSRFLILARSDG